MYGWHPLLCKPFPLGLDISELEEIGFTIKTLVASSQLQSQSPNTEISNWAPYRSCAIDNTGLVLCDSGALWVPTVPKSVTATYASPIAPLFFPVYKTTQWNTLIQIPIFSLHVPVWGKYGSLILTLPVAGKASFHYFTHLYLEKMSKKM